MRRHVIILLYCCALIAFWALYSQQLTMMHGAWLLVGALLCTPVFAGNKPFLSALHGTVVLFVPIGVLLLADTYNTIPSGFTTVLAGWGNPQVDHYEELSKIDAAALFWLLSLIPLYGILYALYSTVLRAWKEVHAPAGTLGEKEIPPEQ